ncbi:MAG: Bug family tripartite tricarboxylate transporter substrate binding protein [Quisquiliibacterium sp.]|jgi:tripartite-type tricarboxylate transporter receptor subunit TctC
MKIRLRPGAGFPRVAALLALAVTVQLAPAPAQAAGFPERPLQLIVPFTPGGNADIVARIVAQGMSEELGQPVVVMNKPGASAAIGAEFVARAAPDGYTMLFGTAESHALNPHLRKNLPYDPLKQLATAGIIDRFPLSLVSSPAVPAQTLGDFVAHAKVNDGKLNFASWGNGSVSQIAFEQIMQITGIRMTHIPFKGAAPAITAVAAGDVQAFVVPLSVAVPQAASGRVRLLAVLSGAREKVAPQTPTAIEQGVNVTISGWHVLAVPAGTPAATMQRLNSALNAVTSRADIGEKLAKTGAQAEKSTLESAEQMVRDEWTRWGEVARRAGLTAQ